MSKKNNAGLNKNMESDESDSILNKKSEISEVKRPTMYVDSNDEMFFVDSDDAINLNNKI